MEPKYFFLTNSQPHGMTGNKKLTFIGLSEEHAAAACYHNSKNKNPDTNQRVNREKRDAILETAKSQLGIHESVQGHTEKPHTVWKKQDEQYVPLSTMEIKKLLETYKKNQAEKG